MICDICGKKAEIMIEWEADKQGCDECDMTAIDEGVKKCPECGAKLVNDLYLEDMSLMLCVKCAGKKVVDIVKRIEKYTDSGRTPVSIKLIEG